MSKHPIRILLIYIVGAIAVAAFLGNAGPLLKYKSLAAEGVGTIGVVVRPDCGNHNTFRYRFNASEKDYESSGTAGVATNCHALLAGDQVKIWYLPRNPEVNMSGDPHSALGNEVLSIAMASILMPAFAIFGISLKWRSRKGRRQAAVPP
jgi:hypothetical protein